jgi:hypothetical protein
MLAVAATAAALTALAGRSVTGDGPCGGAQEGERPGAFG